VNLKLDLFVWGLREDIEHDRTFYK